MPEPVEDEGPFDGEDEGLPLCPNCMRENRTDADFCVECGRPMGATAGVDPLKQIYFEGWAYRKAASGPVTPIILVGIWVIFGLSLVLHFLLGFGHEGGIEQEPLRFLMFLVGYGICVGILYRVTKGYLSRRKP